MIEFPQQNYQLRNTSCRMITVTNKYVVLENTFALGTNFEITYTCIRQQHECIQNKTIPIQSTQIVCNGTTFLFPFQSIKQGTFLWNMVFETPASFSQTTVIFSWCFKSLSISMMAMFFQWKRLFLWRMLVPRSGLCSTTIT